MLRLAVFACFLVVVFSAIPEFSFRDGHCQNVSSLQNFDQTQLFNFDWKLMVHSDPNQHEGGCCTCATVKYERESDTSFKSYRVGTNTENQRVEFWSLLTKKPGDPFNRYLFQYRDNNEWKQTGMLTSFYFPPGDNNFLMVYGCMNHPTEQKFADIALMMTKDNDSPTKINLFKQHLTANLAGQPNYFSVSQSNCA